MKTNMIVAGKNLSKIDQKVLKDYRDNVVIHHIPPEELQKAIIWGRNYEKITKGSYNILVIPNVIEKKLIYKILINLNFVMNFLTLIVRDLEGELSQANIDGYGKINFSKIN